MFAIYQQTPLSLGIFLKYEFIFDRYNNIKRVNRKIDQR